MRLYHVSEEPDISVFLPRPPSRSDLDPDVGLVWAIDEARLPNYLTPRDCPRVAYHVAENTSLADRKRFFSSETASYVVAIEARWLERMRETMVCLYEFDPRDFVLQDACAGYYVARTPQIPVAKCEIRDLLGELARRNVEIRIVDQLWDLADAVRASTLNWSLCRMRNAQPRLHPPQP